ncbi:hypothetical protein MRX96_023318 [Rhipicephalus microplus]
MKLPYNGEPCARLWPTGRNTRLSFLILQLHVHGIMADVPVITNEPSAKRSGAAAVNAAMVTLRRLIPTEPKDRKLSKLETLRLAAVYIRHLSATQLQVGENACTPTVCVFCITERRDIKPGNAHYDGAGATNVGDKVTWREYAPGQPPPTEPSR